MAKGRANSRIENYLATACACACLAKQKFVMGKLLQFFHSIFYLLAREFSCWNCRLLCNKPFVLISTKLFIFEVWKFLPSFLPSFLLLFFCSPLFAVGSSFSATVLLLFVRILTDTYWVFPFSVQSGFLVSLFFSSITLNLFTFFSIYRIKILSEYISL